MRAAGPDGLLERGAELQRLRDTVAGAAGGAGALALIEGPAGIGKTALLGAAGALADEHGMRLLAARGRELEQSFAYGVARQLFERTLVAVPAAQRAGLYEGAAGLARPLFEAGDAGTGGTEIPGQGLPRPAADVTFALAHGLYWLTANLADERPLLIALDDAQQSDAPSLQFVAYLAARCRELPVLLLLTVRTGEPTPADALLETVRADADAVLLRPGALSPAGVAAVVRGRLGEDADPAFCAACGRVSAGNPFLLGELLAELAIERIPADGANAARVQAVRPDSVSRAVLARLARLGHDAADLARAAAVLERAPLRVAAELAHLDGERAGSSADRLLAAQILTGPDPLAFVHPLLRDAIYEQIPPAARAAGHQAAARLLAAAGAPATIAGEHLLRAAPAGDAEAVELLRRAAAEALTRGDPAGATRLLERALDEPPGVERRPLVLAELAEAMAIGRDARAAEHLRAAIAAAGDPAVRARLAALLAELLTWIGAPAEGHAVLTAMLAGLPEDAPARLRAAIETMRMAIASVDQRLVAEVEPRLPALHALARAAGPHGRALKLFEGAWLAQRGPYDGDWRALLEAGLDGGRFVADNTAGAPMVGYVTIVLILADEVDRARALLADIRADARARGSILAHTLDVAWSAMLALRGGDLPTAAEDARTALALAERHQTLWAVTWMVACLADALREQGELGEAAEAIERAPIESVLGTAAALHALMARARTRLARGDQAGAVADLRTAGENVIVNNPSYVPWRSTLALALAGENPAEAEALVQAELARARELGQPRGVGVALRAAGLLAGGEAAIAALELSVDALRASPARLELARALCDLGAAERRAGHRVAAREPLREAIELAVTCGAAPLAARAREELLATGARPRREQTSGPASLTPSERRVAELAAAGLANREIAQSLFVTTKTVGTHLAHIYQKLDLQGARAREQLADRLGVAG